MLILQIPQISRHRFFGVLDHFVVDGFFGVFFKDPHGVGSVPEVDPYGEVLLVGGGFLARFRFHGGEDYETTGAHGI